MKLSSISSPLNSRASSFYQNIQRQPLRTTPTGTHFSRKGSVSDSLYSRISPLGDPNVSVVPVLDQWIREGNSAYRGELRRVINELTTYRRFKHALEVSLWMTNKRHFPVTPFDVSVRLKLIFKMFGMEQVENYFNKIPENLKAYPVYLALLNCYTIAKSVDKAEFIMQKVRDLGYASKPIWYNLMMNLHCQLGNREKLGDLLTEMEAKGICYDQFTYFVCLGACAMASDAGEMDKIVMMMESDPRVIVHWRTYFIAAQGYLRLGLTDKALTMLNKLEQLTTSEQDYILFVFLLKLYAEIGKKDELYRIWDMYKRKGKVVNKVYISMIRSLMKFDDIESVEKIFEEWESSGPIHFDFRIPNFLIDAYCTDGRLEKAEALITKGISKGGDPLVTTWCHLAGGYLKKDQVPKAVEVLKKAISICPPKFMSQKDTLNTCLEYLGNRDCMKKAEDLIKSISMRSVSQDVVPDDLCGLNKDDELFF